MQKGGHLGIFKRPRKTNYCSLNKSTWPPQRGRVVKPMLTSITVFRCYFIYATLHDCWV